MNDEMIVVLENSYMGEEIINYIRTLEREYAAARKENEKLNRALDKACEQLEGNEYFNGLDYDEVRGNFTPEEWKEWLLTYV